MRRPAVTIIFPARFLCCAFFSLLAAGVFADNAGIQPLTFARAADLAVGFSAELRHSRASQALKEGAWRSGIRSYFPRLNLTAAENDRLQEIGSDSFVKNYGVNFEQLVWDGGKLAMSRKLERTELNLSSSALKRMEDEIAEASISAYRKVLSSRAILEIRKSALFALKEQRRILNEEVALGLSLSVDLADADLNLAGAELEILSIQLDLLEIERQFAELLGFDSLPVLAEKVDINRSIRLPKPAAAQELAREKNPDIEQARFSIAKKQAELRYASNSWMPALSLTGNFTLTGQRYPLNRYNWSVGINIDFSGPWFANKAGVQAGIESPNDRTAFVQDSFYVLPDPAAAFGKKQAQVSLSLEREKYNVILERTGRMANNAVEKCALAEQKRVLALGALALSSEKRRIEEIRLSLGQITRLELMETLIEHTQREIAAVEAAASLLEAERELEKFLDLRPGGLALFAAANEFTFDKRN